jgi:predicted metalloprotease
MGGGRLGLGGLLLLLLLSAVFHRDLVSMFYGGEAPAPVSQSYANRSAGNDREVQFVSFILDDAQRTWDQLLPESAGTPYRHAKLVLFDNYTPSGCGLAQSATGPFYCPADEKVYIDLGFFQDLRDRYGAPGEFAQAYVLAHEIGHHVQKVLGIEGKVRRLQQANPGARNPLSVALELQADCLAGVWGHSTAQRDLIDAADIEAGIRAAGAVGDDRLQKAATGTVSPENFTHGSSAQRAAWFRRGLEEGTISSFDTMAPR